jgi:hypothetical protein
MLIHHPQKSLIKKSRERQRLGGRKKKEGGGQSGKRSSWKRTSISIQALIMALA